MFVTGLIVALFLPAKADEASQQTLWTWLTMRRRAREAKIEVGELG